MKTYNFFFSGSDTNINTQSVIFYKLDVVYIQLIKNILGDFHLLVYLFGFTQENGIIFSAI